MDPVTHDPESDPPIVRNKGRQTADGQSSPDYSTDPTTDDEAVQRRQGPRKATRNVALEDAMDRNSEGAAPSIITKKKSTSNLLQKARPKPKRITKQHRRQDATFAQDTTDETVQHREGAAPSTTPVVESNLLQKARPKPRPITKQPRQQGPTSAEEQRIMEDGLFLRKSTRLRVEKVREAPPAQLRLEKDALKRKGRGKD